MNIAKGVKEVVICLSSLHAFLLFWVTSQNWGLRFKREELDTLLTIHIAQFH